MFNPRTFSQVLANVLKHLTNFVNLKVYKFSECRMQIINTIFLHFVYSIKEKKKTNKTQMLLKLISISFGDETANHVDFP